MPFRFAFKKYSLPLRAPLRTAHGPWAQREGLIVRLENDSGQIGFGEIAPIPWFGTETLADAEERCRGVGDRVEEAVFETIPIELSCVRFAFDQAREAIRAHSAAAPAGISSPLLQRLPVAALLPAGKKALELLDSKLEAGFLSFKWKVGVDRVEEELPVLDELLSRLPMHALLRLDANGAWMRRDAEKWLARCAERPIEFVEQPVSPGADDVLRGLADDYPVTLALDESVVRLEDARRWQAEGWRGVFVIKPALAGPLSETMDWVRATKADVVISSAIETTLARSAILRAALSGGLTKRALGFGTGEMFGDRTFDGPAIGPLADAACVAKNPGEAMWNALA